MTIFLIFILCLLSISPVFADVYINLMAVNGSPVRKETPVKFNLPGDVKAEDILDTNGLQLEYNVNDGNYVVSGTVALDTKESKTFRIRLKDIWKMSPEEADRIKDEINKGFEEIGKQFDADKAELLRGQLMKKLDLIIEHQATKAETIEKRIDAARAYRKEMQRILDQALAVDYWRSEPGDHKDKLIKLRIEAQNPTDNSTNKVKIKSYLPVEVKPQHVFEAQGFEVRYDQLKQQPFLFKEDEIPVGEKREFQVSILDVWVVPQREIDYLRSRANYCWGFLKSSRYEQSAKILFDHANVLLEGVEASQAQPREIKEHISAFRANQNSFNGSRTDVENLEKLLAIHREDLEKSKVENVLGKIRSLKGIDDLSKKIFDKKPTPSNTWTYIGWVVMFLAFLTVVYFVVLIMRSGGKGKAPAAGTPAQPGQGPAQGQEPPKVEVKK